MKNLPRARNSNLLSPYRWELPRVPREFLYTLTAGCCAQKREEKTTPRTQAWLPLSKGLSPSAPNLPYRKSRGSKPGQYLCVKTISFRLTLSAVAGLLEMMEDGGGRAGKSDGPLSVPRKASVAPTGKSRWPS